MVQPGIGGLDTPRTNVGDATYLSRQPDFDISQELSFQSPSKDASLAQQLRNGSRPNLRTPRGSRAPFADRRNLPSGLGGPEFTPLLKSATRNSARRYGAGKENGRATPAFLDKIDEDMTPMPPGETSVYGASRNTSSYMASTPLPAVDSSSAASTPVVMRRRDNAKGPLDDGNQLSLREQENVIDKIEKENFGLKLKIHFLEEALRKAGPGFSEAALKENTELKVDKVTMQRELQRYKKHLSSAEKGLEAYRQQILEMQEKAQRAYADEHQQAELDQLRQAVQDKDAVIEDLQRQLEDERGDQNKVEELEDEIGDLQADLRRRDDVITQHEDEIQELREKVAKAEEQLKETQHLQDEHDRAEKLEDEIAELEDEIRGKDDVITQQEVTIKELQEKFSQAEERLSKTQQRVTELEEGAQDGQRLKEARAKIENLEAKVRQLEQQVADANKSLQEAVSERNNAETYIDELEDKLQRHMEQSKEKAEDGKRLKEAKGTIESLEANVRRLEQQMDGMKKQLQDTTSQKDRAEAELHEVDKEIQRYMVELEEKAQDGRRLKEAQGTIESLETSARRLEQQMDDMKKKLQDAISRKDRAEADLAELQEEMANKSVVTKGLSRQVEEKMARLQADADKARQECAALERERSAQQKEMVDMRAQLAEARQERDSAEHIRLTLEAELQRVQADLNMRSDEKDLLHTRHDALTSESASLQKEISDLRKSVTELEDSLRRERQHALDIERELRQSQLDCQSRAEKVQALEDEVEVLQATLDVESENGEKARSELDQARRECERLKQHLASLQAAADLARASSPDGNTEISFLQRELSAARQKEIEQLKHDAAQKETIKSLKRQIADLERQSHEAALAQLAAASPSSSSPGGSSARKAEISELRHQLSTANQSIHDLKKTLREADRKAAALARELQTRLDRLEDENLQLEQALEDARSAAEEAAAAHEEALKKVKQKLDKYRRERDDLTTALRDQQQQAANDSNHSGLSSEMSPEERRELRGMLRESQTAADRLGRELREHREALEEAVAAEAALRKKLERARSERAAYRASAERLRKDLGRLEAERDKAVAEAAAANEERTLALAARPRNKPDAVVVGKDGADTDAIIRAVEAAEERHEKEIRGLVMQMEWLKACWDREARLRDDVVFAKRFLLAEVQIRDAWYVNSKPSLFLISRIVFTFSC